MADAIDEIKDGAKPAIKTARAAAKNVSTRVKTARIAAADEIDDDVDELEDHLTALGDEISVLAHQIERFAGHRLDDVRHMASDIGEAGGVAIRRAGRQTAIAARAVREDPLPTVIALGVVALLTSLVISRLNQR